MEHTGIGEEELTALNEIAVKLAELSGISVDEACNNISKAMQFLSEGVTEVVERLKELFGTLIETCESCKRIIDRRTRHGSSSRTEKPRQARITIKWWEKYRPP